MNNKWKIIIPSIAAICLVVMVIAGLYINAIGWNNVKLMIELNKHPQAIVAMEAEGEYLAKNKHHRELLKEKMKNEGWTFIQQEGSGYFFEKNGEQAIITARQIWNRHHIVLSVNNNVVDLSK